VERPYSIDDNLWGRSSEGGVIEDLSQPPPEGVFQLVTPPEEAPDRAEDLVVGFRDGLPVSLDGTEMPLVALIQRVAEVAARNGVGIVDHIEDRVVGLKVRDLYEVPAAEVILTAHRELEKLVCTGRENALKPQLDGLWAQLAYEGLWYEPLLADLNGFMEQVNSKVEGEITMRLYKGSARAVARSSRRALYDRQLATFDADPSFSQNASPGFIEIYSLQSRMAHRIREATERG
jgi:argininosuccinate synthase